VNEIRISGFGGQGVIRCGYIIGKTAALFDGKHATLTQSFGPEARGSACSAQIIVDSDPVRYPYLTTPDTVVAMSQEAYDKFGSDITPDGTLMIDDDLVDPAQEPVACRVYAIPATRIAEELGNRIAANIVMLGFFTAITNIISVQAARRALPSSVPPRFLELNENAFEEGYRFGTELMGSQHVPPPAERPPSREYRPSKVTKAKAGRRATTLARVNILDGKARESEQAKKAWKAAGKKGAKLKAAARKALDKKTADAEKKPASAKKSAAKSKPARKKAAKTPATKKKAVAKRPTAKKAVARKPATKKKAVKKSTATKKAAAKRPAAKKSTAKKRAATKKPAKKRTTAKRTAVKKKTAGKKPGRAARKSKGTAGRRSSSRRK
jgi:2-oxoglutarate ferredoxin oxidoreductase subunit gamma